MKFDPISDKDRQKAFTNKKKPEVIQNQKLPTRYIVEDHPTEDRPRRFLEAMASILKHTNYGFMLDHFSRVSTRCARCTVQCQIHMATGDQRDVPCYRSEMLLSIYRRHFTLGGALKARLTGDVGLTDEKIQEMADSFYNCTACRRCVLECPMGIDHGLITHLTRWILAEIGIVPRALAVSVREQLVGETRNTSGITLPALKDTLEFLEEDLLDLKGAEVKFPLDQEGADFIFFAPVSDYMMEAETMMGLAASLHAGGASWTIGSQNYDGINYGLFYSDTILERVLKNMEAEAKRLKAKAILIGECGHASRTAKVFYNQFCTDYPLPVYNILEVTHKFLKEGKLKLHDDIITEKVTYHDPCNLARSGWVIDQGREILKAFCKNYVEMEHAGRNNICCGGGGGTVSIDEIRPYRTMIGGKAKAEQVKASGAEMLVAPCANCKKQLGEVIADQKLSVELVGLHDILLKAIELPGGTRPTREDMMMM